MAAAEVWRLYDEFDPPPLDVSAHVCDGCLAARPDHIVWSGGDEPELSECCRACAAGAPGRAYPLTGRWMPTRVCEPAIPADPVAARNIPAALPHSPRPEDVRMYLDGLGNAPGYDPGAGSCLQWVPFGGISEGSAFAFSRVDGRVAGLHWDDHGRLGVQVLFGSFEDYLAARAASSGDFESFVRRTVADRMPADWG